MDGSFWAEVRDAKCVTTHTHTCTHTKNCLAQHGQLASLENTQYSSLPKVNQRDKDKCEMLQRNYVAKKGPVIQINQPPCKNKQNKSLLFQRNINMSTYFHINWLIRFPNTFQLGKFLFFLLLQLQVFLLMVVKCSTEVFSLFAVFLFQVAVLFLQLLVLALQKRDLEQ